MIFMERRNFLGCAAAAALAAGGLATVRTARAADEAPDALIKRLSEELLDRIRSDRALQAGDVNRINRVIDEEVMPYVNFTRMTAATVGPAWRSATPEQRKRMQDEFRTLLIHTYAGALEQVDDQRLEVQPLRAGADDDEVTVRTLVRGGAEPVQVDFRLERTPGKDAGWQIYDLNIMGIWMVANYRSQFRPKINESGLDGLIETLHERNKSNNTGR